MAATTLRERVGVPTVRVDPAAPAGESRWGALRWRAQALGWSHPMLLAWLAVWLDGHPETLTEAEAYRAWRDLGRFFAR